MFLVDGDQIIRANLDGSGGTAILSGIQDRSAIALDVVNQRVFWAEDDGEDKIRSAKFDGTDVETELVLEPAQTVSKRVETLEFADVSASAGPNRLYWTETDGVMPSSILRFNPYLTLRPVQILSLSDKQYITGLALDVQTGLIYFTCTAIRL